MKLTDHTCACNNSTSFECEVQAPGNKSYINLQKLAWKNSWKHFEWTYIRRVLAIWNQCALAFALLTLYLANCDVAAKRWMVMNYFLKSMCRRKMEPAKRRESWPGKKFPILNFVAPPPPPPSGPYSCRCCRRRTRLDPCAVQGFFPNVLHHLFRDQKGL